MSRLSVALGVVVALAVSAPALAQEPLALVGATVVDGSGGPPLADAVVLVKDGRIEQVGGVDELSVPEDYQVVDLHGRYLVPGLVDPHIHFFQSSGLYTRPDILDLRKTKAYEDEMAGIKERVPQIFKRYLACGITAVVDVGGPFWNFEVRKQARASELAPRVAVAGPLVSTVARPRMDIGDPPIIQVSSTDEARALVRKQLEYHPDLVKIWFILPKSGDVKENLPIVRATIDEAHRGGVRVAVHATQLEAARAAVQAGADVLVHSVDDAPVDDEFIQLVKSRGVIYTTTLIVHEGYAEVLARQVRLTPIEARLGDPWARATWTDLDPGVGGLASKQAAADRLARLQRKMPVMQANLRRMVEAGALVAAGTDAGNIGTLHGPALHREFELMAEAGLTPAQILVTATRDAAKVFAKKPDFGVIAPGMQADLLVLDKDPLTDVHHWQAIHRVVLGGRLLDPNALLPPAPETVVQRQVEAYNARDLDAFMAFYHPDIEIITLPGGEVSSKGHETMRQRYGPFFAANPDLHCRIMQRTVSGNFVVDHEFVTGVAKRPRLRAVAIYEVEGDRIRRVFFLPKETP